MIANTSKKRHQLPFNCRTVEIDSHQKVLELLPDIFEDGTEVLCMEGQGRAEMHTAGIVFLWGHIF